MVGLGAWRSEGVGERTQLDHPVPEEMPQSRGSKAKSELSRRRRKEAASMRGNETGREWLTCTSSPAYMYQLNLGTWQEPRPEPQPGPGMMGCSESAGFTRSCPPEPTLYMMRTTYTPATVLENVVYVYCVHGIKAMRLGIVLRNHRRTWVLTALFLAAKVQGCSTPKPRRHVPFPINLRM
jgi:hypothetical protein